MKRRWNIFIWVGFLIVLAGLFSYIPFFVRFPLTRDLPWVNLLLFAAGEGLLALGLKRAFGQPELYRGKVIGVILGTVSMIAFGFFVFGVFYSVRQLPPSKGTPQIGQKAPDFTLLDKDGNAVTLSALLASPANSATRGTNKTNAVLLIFYRGYW